MVLRVAAFDHAGVKVGWVDWQMMHRDEPVAMRVPLRTGQREDRFMHLLCGEAELATDLAEPEIESHRRKNPDAPALLERLKKLEKDMAAVQAELKQLKQ